MCKCGSTANILDVSVMGKTENNSEVFLCRLQRCFPAVWQDTRQRDENRLRPVRWPDQGFGPESYPVWDHARPWETQGRRWAACTFPHISRIMGRAHYAQSAFSLWWTQLFHRFTQTCRPKCSVLSSFCPCTNTSPRPRTVERMRILWRVSGCLTRKGMVQSWELSSGTFWQPWVSWTFSLWAKFMWSSCCNKQWLTRFLDRRWEDEWGRGGAADAKPRGR